MRFLPWRCVTSAVNDVIACCGMLSTQDAELGGGSPTKDGGDEEGEKEQEDEELGSEDLDLDALSDS
jgi:hypothetical protein